MVEMNAELREATEVSGKMQPPQFKRKSPGADEKLKDFIGLILKRPLTMAECVAFRIVYRLIPASVSCL